MEIEDEVRLANLAPKARLVFNVSEARSGCNLEHKERFEHLTRVAKASESALEKAFEVSSSFRSRFGLHSLMRQWRVGVFLNKVSGQTEHAHFPGRKSAVDLVGLSGADTLCIFELKTGSNKKAGGLSELFFYAGLLREGLRGNICFDRDHAAKGCGISPAEIKQAKRIRAVLLAPEFHPLLRGGDIIKQLNAASDARWTDYPVDFELCAFTPPESASDDFAFSAAAIREAA